VWPIALALGATLLPGKWWVDRSPGAGRGGDVCAFMALGLYFSFEPLVTGSL
jgi:hypothetical protein